MTEGKLIVTSPAFVHMEKIPEKYTCAGEDVNPELNISGIPAGTKFLVLIVEDPDAPNGTWNHWIVWNIPPRDKIKENTIPGVQGLNSAGTRNWHGPCPPSGTHRYYFKVYALDTGLTLPPSAIKREVLSSMEGHVLAEGELVGTFSK